MKKTLFALLFMTTMIPWGYAGIGGYHDRHETAPEAPVSLVTLIPAIPSLNHSESSAPRPLMSAQNPGTSMNFGSFVLTVGHSF